jgi:uncharacterized protein (TIGR02246 family)
VTQDPERSFDNDRHDRTAHIALKGIVSWSNSALEFKLEQCVRLLSLPVWAQTCWAGAVRLLIFDRWPTRQGFDKFYGFIGGETDQWYPLIYDGVIKVDPPKMKDYHFTVDDVLPEEGSIRQQRQERNVMRGLIASCISIVALYLSLAFTGMALADTATDVKAVYAAWDAAFNKGDAQAIAAFYTDDAIVLPPSQVVIKGRADVEKFTSGLFEIGMTSSQLELIEVAVDGAGTIAAIATWSVKHRGVPGGGFATSIFTKQPDGTLKIKLLMFNWGR